MRSMRLRSSLAAAIIPGLALLIAGVFGLGVAIRQGVVAPPDLGLAIQWTSSDAPRH